MTIKVMECPVNLKPCRDKRSGNAYIRAYDGDFVMSTQEIQGFSALQHAPVDDCEPVSAAKMSDLDSDLLDSWRQTARLHDARGLGRFDDDEILVHAGICTPERTPTLAGLIALGVHPQRFFPSYVMNCATVLGAPGVRASDIMTLTGPIPLIIARAMEWAQQTFTRYIVQREDGHVADALEYPAVAFRELISNSLIHRDYAPWSRGTAIEIRRRPDQLIITNPGGLYGLNKDQLDSRPMSSSRNTTLLYICKYIRLDESGTRVVEALAQGIPTVKYELNQAGLPPATYDDSGILFNVRLRNRVYLANKNQQLLASLSRAERALIDEVGQGHHTIADLAQRLDRDGESVRRSLKKLQDIGLVSAQKTMGSRAFRYVLSSNQL